MRNWGSPDPAPGVPLDLIPLGSARIEALIARSRSHPRLRFDYIRVFGASLFVRGMEYHHTNTMRMLERLRRRWVWGRTRRQLKEDLEHEAVAYVGRAGQLVHFALSPPVGMKAEDIPKLMELKHFRDKFTAHRSIDRPRPEDDENVQRLHAMSLTAFGGYGFEPKHANVRYDPTFDEVRRWRNYYLVYQARIDRERIAFFSVERDHPLVLRESWGIFRQLLKQGGLDAGPPR